MVDDKKIIDVTGAELKRPYIVRFIRADGAPIEEYFYEQRADADQHLNMFCDDDSGLYKRIAILNDETRTVERVLVFVDGKLRMDLCDHDVVRLRSGYRKPEEARYLFSVSNIHEEFGRCLITPINDGLPLPSSESVGLEMVDRVCSQKDMQ